MDKYLKRQRGVDLKSLSIDPAKRKKISLFHPNDQDEVRRAYLLRGPCQPRNCEFEQKEIGGVLRRFNPSWYDQYSTWLEYNTTTHAAFCLCCYLFRRDTGKQAGGDAFVIDGFTCWNKKDRFDTHIGIGPNSAHNQAWRKCEDLMKQNQHIQAVINKQSERAKSDYRIRLTASVDCVRFLFCQGLAFRGHDESISSGNRGNFLELLQFLADHNESINNVVLQNSPRNLKMVTQDIQKDIVNAAAVETTNAILKDLREDLFAILVDESRDVSIKEQLAVILRYVDGKGIVTERFLGIVHVTDTAASSLKLDN